MPKANQNAPRMSVWKRKLKPPIFSLTWLLVLSMAFTSFSFTRGPGR